MIYLCTENARIPLKRMTDKQSPGWPLVKEAGAVYLIFFCGIRNGRPSFLKASATHILCIRHEKDTWFIPLWNKFSYGLGGDGEAEETEYLSFKKEMSQAPVISTHVGSIYSKLPGLCVTGPGQVGGDVRWQN